MKSNAEITPADRRDREAMFKLFQSRGPMTEKDLLAAGISLDSQARNAAAVAERIRLADPLAA